MSTKVNLLGLSGSLRAQSAHTAVLRTVAECLPELVRLELFGLGSLPPYNEDCDGVHAPLEVLALREAVARSDGLLIGSPEYNHGMSGVLKNALDWLSRPHGQSVLSGRAVLTFTASPAFTGGVRAHQQLNETLWAIQARLVQYPQIVIGSSGSKTREGRLVDDASRRFLMAGIECLLEQVRSSQRLRS
ncbi:NADPH-dependent FMN reductase [Pseudomonas sp. BNK-15]|uniref:NADPH-dependent FMN reductase n=1 Tax=Pseudomonas sp. BNK-15 TaxID=3376152 RepID=UPI0039BF66C0